MLLWWNIDSPKDNKGQKKANESGHKKKNKHAMTTTVIIPRNIVMSC